MRKRNHLEAGSVSRWPAPIKTCLQMYFHVKRTEWPGGGFRFQEAFRGYDVQAKPQYDGVAAVAAIIFGYINGSGREELHLLMLCIAGTPACNLGFHF